MRLRWFHLGCAAVCVAVAVGCKKPSDTGRNVLEKAASEEPRVSETLLHWAGKNAILESRDGAYLKAVWNLPEAARLEQQTLDKIALALSGDTSRADVTDSSAILRQNARASSLRPLLQDVYERGCSIRLTHATNQVVEFSLSLDLGQERLSSWKTNLATLQGIKKDWDVSVTNLGSRLVVNSSPGKTKSRPMGLPPQGQQPKGADWLAVSFASADWPRFAALFPSNLAPVVSLSLAGAEGSNILTTAELKFPAAMGFQLSDWMFPTNAIQGPVASFTAARGLGVFLSRVAALANAKPESMPDQFFAWARGQVPTETCIAARVENGGKWMQDNGQALASAGTSLLGTNAYGSFSFDPSKAALSWGPLPIVAPTMKPWPDASGSFVLLTLASTPTNTSPPPPGWFANISESTNMCYYDWELTRDRLHQWLFMGQLTRLTLQCQQLPTNAAALRFIVSAAPHLGPSLTRVSVESPDKLRLSRKSSLGFTGVELNLLADWLESPLFPHGLRTALAPRLKRPVGPMINKPSAKRP